MSSRLSLRSLGSRLVPHPRRRRLRPQNDSRHRPNAMQLFQVEIALVKYQAKSGFELEDESKCTQGVETEFLKW